MRRQFYRHLEVSVDATALLRAWLKRRRLRRLLDYDDRRLKDLGFHREDLLWALRLPLNQDPIQALRRRHQTVSSARRT